MSRTYRLRRDTPKHCVYRDDNQLYTPEFPNNRAYIKARNEIRHFCVKYRMPNSFACSYWEFHNTPYPKSIYKWHKKETAYARKKYNRRIRHQSKSLTRQEEYDLYPQYVKTQGWLSY